MKPWWVTQPERLAFELQELERLGADVADVTKDESTGGLTVRFSYTVRGEKTTFRAEYPPFYPYVRFELYADEWALTRHQNPFARNLCLLGRASENWEITDTVAGLLREQLPVLLDVVEETDKGAVSGREAAQGEPLSAFLPYEDDSIVLVDSEWDLRDAKSGTFRAAIERGTPFRAAVLEVYDGTGTLLASCSDAVRRRFNNLPQITAKWMRLSVPVRERSAANFVTKAGIAEVRWATVNGERIDLHAVLFPEELSWRAEGEGWIFVLRRPVERPGFRSGRATSSAYLRAGRFGEADTLWRIPEMRPLMKKTVALVGSGCLGSAAAVEFARAGVGNLRVMDEDIVEPASTIRWALGLNASGRSKVAALCDFIGSQYPYTRVSAFQKKFGPALTMGGVDLAFAERFLEGADVLVDATAEWGIHYLLATIARERGIPYVSLSATPGAWGGIVLRLDSRRTQACWSCYARARESKVIPSPSEDPAALDQPPGCAEPTFTGASFDLANVVAAGVRMTVSTLGEGSYPDLPFDGSVLSLRDRNGASIEPRWEPFALAVDPTCRNHSN